MFYYTSRLILVVVLALFAAVLHQGVINTRTQTSPDITENVQIQDNDNFEIATVSRVIDGDTIKLTDGRRVRYIGIDAPEMNFTNPLPSECFAKKATQKNKELVGGKQIRMISDVNNTDKYGRLLRYVYVNDLSSNLDVNTSVNEILVADGVAMARSYPPDVTLQEVLRKAEAKARANKRGLWADNACKD